MKHKKVYFTAYGQVISFSLSDAIKVLENVIKYNGAWDLTNGQKLKREVSWAKGFHHGKTYKLITARFPTITDNWKEDSKKEDIQYLIYELKKIGDGK